MFCLKFIVLITSKYSNINLFLPCLIFSCLSLEVLLDLVVISDSIPSYLLRFEKLIFHLFFSDHYISNSIYLNILGFFRLLNK